MSAVEGRMQIRSDKKKAWVRLRGLATGVVQVHRFVPPPEGEIQGTWQYICTIDSDAAANDALTEVDLKEPDKAQAYAALRFVNEVPPGTIPNVRVGLYRLEDGSAYGPNGALKDPNVERILAQDAANPLRWWFVEQLDWQPTPATARGQG